MENPLILDNIAVIWLVAGAICVLIEAFSAPGIGFLFAGLAAIAVGGLVSIAALDPDNILVQIAWFFAFTAMWAAVLWKPMKRLHYKTSDKEYKNIIGNTAIVKGEPLTKKSAGKVDWSGTIMKARVAKDSIAESIPVGEEVRIVSVEGSKFLVKTLDEPDIASEDTSQTDIESKE